MLTHPQKALGVGMSANLLTKKMRRGFLARRILLRNVKGKTQVCEEKNKLLIGELHPNATTHKSLLAKLDANNVPSLRLQRRAHRKKAEYRGG